MLLRDGARGFAEFGLGAGGGDAKLGGGLLLFLFALFGAEFLEFGQAFVKGAVVGGLVAQIDRSFCRSG